MIQNNRTKTALAAFGASLLLAFGASGAYAAGPQGFGAQTAAQPGLSGMTTVAKVLEAGRDEDVVRLRGRFTKHIEDDKYEFVDEAGGAIRAELDDDNDWTMIAKDKPVEIEAEVDRYKEWIKLDVIRAKPL